MDFQIIRILDHHFSQRKPVVLESVSTICTEKEVKIMDDYHLIITEYIKWEKEEFRKKVAIWEREAKRYEMGTVALRLCA